MLHRLGTVVVVIVERKGKLRILLRIDFIDWLLPQAKTTHAFLAWFHVLQIDSSKDIGVIALCLSIIDNVSFSMALQNGGHASSEISDCEAFV